MFRQLRIPTKTLTNPSCLPPTCRSSSSSSSRPPQPEVDPDSANDSPPRDNATAGGSPPSKSSSPYSTYFSDIKERLKSSPSPPRRISTNLQPPSAFSAAAKPAAAASLEEIRKHLSEFRQRSSGPSSGDHPPPRSFQDLLKNDRTGSDAPRVLSLEAIRESLSKFQSSPRENEGFARNPGFNIRPFQDELRKGFGEDKRGSQLIGTEKLPESIFGKERREKKGEREEEPTVRRTEFVKMYSYEELGEKLRKLRPEKDGKKDQSFSLSELNERLAKLRELEEKETESRLGGVSFRDLRESLQRLKDADAKKKANMGRFTFFATMGSPGKPAYMLKPQEHLVENYFHPDHMSSGEKLKLELKKVRDEYKTSENDCGSTQVQVAQLTTKIKHLSSVLHKKDKHSRKGLLEMVQLRKKLLKYLRRTDWDSYCVILSKLGLRDVPDYKIANYKN